MELGTLKMPCVIVLTANPENFKALLVTAKFADSLYRQQTCYSRFHWGGKYGFHEMDVKGIIMGAHPHAEPDRHKSARPSCSLHPPLSQVSLSVCI
jgi:hypothetical protein